MSDGLRVTFFGSKIKIGTHEVSVAYPIKDAFFQDGTLVVLYEYMSGPRSGVFRNLEAFDLSGRKLWTAENPTTSSADAYTEIKDRNPLSVWNFAGYLCLIDPKTGKILEAIFTK